MMNSNNFIIIWILNFYKTHQEKSCTYTLMWSFLWSNSMAAGKVSPETLIKCNVHAYQFQTEIVPLQSLHNNPFSADLIAEPEKPWLSKVSPDLLVKRNGELGIQKLDNFETLLNFNFDIFCKISLGTQSRSGAMYHVHIWDEEPRCMANYKLSPTITHMLQPSYNYSSLISQGFLCTDKCS